MPRVMRQRVPRGDYRASSDGRCATLRKRDAAALAVCSRLRVSPRRSIAVRVDHVTEMRRNAIDTVQADGLRLAGIHCLHVVRPCTEVVRKLLIGYLLR